MQIGINLTKEQAQQQFINLKKTVDEVVLKKGLGDQKARVGLVIDISVSMRHLFSNGTVQAVVERLLALGVKFDDNKAIDIYTFGVKSHDLGELHENDFYQYISRNIRERDLEGGTNYAGVMKRVVDKYKSQREGGLKGFFKGLTGSKSGLLEPAYIMFLTDGDNGDKSEAEKIIREASQYPIFWQFVGIGSSRFPFLEQLDDMSGRVIDNADFFQLNDFKNIDDRELYSRLLNEFPNWIREAKAKGIVK